jgi:enediyne biosynthesis protein E4
VARGAAYGDFDNDGDLDVLITTNHGPAYLLRNDANTAKNYWISVRLRGVKSNRNGIGAVVRVESASGRQWRMVHSGSSYLSQSDLAVTFGLGKDSRIAALEIEWPGGAKQRIANPPVNRRLLVTEGKGAEPLGIVKK